MKPVKSLQEVSKNAEAFSKIERTKRSIALDNFNLFFHWYYFPDQDIFAPSKFIGYKNTNLLNYKGTGSGSETQRTLREWFKKLRPEDEQFIFLREKLERFASLIGRRISKKTFSGTGGIYVPTYYVIAHDFPDEISDLGIFEGAKRKVIVNAYERSNEAREKCIEHYGAKCSVCNFSFDTFYGEALGKGFIHVHHLLDIAQIGREYKVDPIKDLRPVCPNCHAMLHRQTPAMDLDKLKALIRRSTAKDIS